MNTKNLLNAPSLTHEKSLKTLIENRSVYSLDNCELNLFETYQTSFSIPLKFNDLLVTSMLRGKKVMRLSNDPEFDYLPGETVLVPSGVELNIDFPEATWQNPTQCLALAIDHNKISNILHSLNENYPRQGNTSWELDYKNYFFYNNAELACTINRLIKECMDTSITKDVLVDLSLQELLIRIIQTQNLQTIQRQTKALDNKTVIPFIAQHIRENITKNFSLKDLSDKANMTPISFYRYFKRELGLSPTEYILHERIKKAKRLLRKPGIQVNEVCFLAGFEDSNYFIRLFKKYEGITPKQYQILHIK